MTVDDLRVLVTVASFAAFVGIVVWACSRGRREAFDLAARLPFDDGPGDGSTAGERVRDANR